MVYVYGSSILSAFTYGESVIAIYNKGVKVWPDWYIYWTPSTLNEQFKMNGVTYNMSEYSGFFTYFSRSITSGAFMSTGITTLDTNAQVISNKAFMNCTSLETASLSEVLYIKSQAFNGCTSLNSIYMPVCQSLGYAAFQNCVNLSKVYLPSCTYIDMNTFYGCSSLWLVETPVCKSLMAGAFVSCPNLETVYLPKIQYIDDYVFGGATDVVLESNTVCTFNNNIFTNAMPNHMIYVPESLVSTYVSTYPSYYVQSQAGGLFPSYPIFGSLYYIKWAPENSTGTFSLRWSNSTHTFNMSSYTYNNYYVHKVGVNGVISRLTITSSAFKNKTVISSINTNAFAIQESAFYNCIDLQTVTLTKCSYIGLYAFAKCSALTNVTINTSSVCNLETNAFYDTTTKFYVPQSLLNAYKADINWSYYKTRIYSIT